MIRATHLGWTLPRNRPGIKGLAGNKFFRPVAGFALLLTGCGKPDEVQVVRTPIPNIFLTFETWNNGPLVSDRQKLVVHYTHGDKSKTQTILDGDYLVISKYTWTAPRRLTICLKEGTTQVFQNEINFWIDGAHEEFHVTLRDDCDVSQKTPV